MSGNWKNVGAGFSGVEKFTCVISDVASGEVEKEKDVDIAMDNTPKGTRKRRKKQSLTASPESYAKISNVQWKQDEFLENFQGARDQDEASQRSEEIYWSESSSDDDLSKNISTTSIQGEGLFLEKQRGKFSTSCILRKKRSLFHYASEELNSSLGLCISDQDCEHENQGKRREILKSSIEKRWNTGQTFSEKNDNNQCEKPACSHEIFSNKYTIKSDESKGRLFKQELFNRAGLPSRISKPGVVRRLELHISQESTGGISNVGSISDEECGVEDEESDCDISNGDVDANICNKILSQVSQDTIEEPVVSSSSVAQSGEKRLQVDGDDFSSGTEEDHISSGSSGALGGNVKVCSIRASEWVLALSKQKTPVKERDSETQHGHDSAQKKKKFTRDSLAGRLSRLLNREKSAVRFWYHSMHSGTFDDDVGGNVVSWKKLYSSSLRPVGRNCKPMVLELVSMVRQFSAYVCECREVEESQPRASCKALFLKSTVDALGLRAGMAVSLYPPWRQLEDSKGMRTILCTQHISTEMPRDTTGTSSVQTREPPSIGSRIKVCASWKCPCSQDVRMPRASCPASRNPVVPPLTSCYLNHSEILSHSEMSACMGPVKLHSVYKSSCVSLPSPGVRRTLLETMETVQPDTGCLPPFVASVLRVFRHWQQGVDENISYQLLMEDDAGTVAVCTLSGEREWEAIVKGLEGATCMCSELRVVNRSNQDREPWLFRIIESAWTRRENPVVSDTIGTDGSQGFQAAAKAPKFCYILRAVDGASPVFHILHRAQGQGPASLELVPQENVLDTLQTGVRRRLSFAVKTIYIRNKRDIEATEGLDLRIFLCGRDGETTAVHKLSVKSECVIPDLRQMSAVCLCLFRDMALEEGVLTCDGYTMVLCQASWVTWGLTTRLDCSLIKSAMLSVPKLPSVTSASMPGTLASVAGVICGIDESQAYTWEECPVCGTDQLTDPDPPTQNLFCSVCSQPVALTVVKMKMETLVRIQNAVPALVVRLDLTERSIQALLPTSADDHGYDLECVLGQPVTAPLCLVQHNNVTLLSVSGSCRSECSVGHDDSTSKHGDKDRLQEDLVLVELDSSCQ